VLQPFTVCPIVGSHSCPVHLGCLSSGSALLTMVAVSKPATFENVRESIALSLDFYLNKGGFKQGGFKGGVGA